MADCARDDRGRKREVRPATISVKRLTRREILAGRAEFPELDHWRPQTRGDCANGCRPCPYVGCRWNLYLDVTYAGAIKLNFPDLEPGEMGESCALDVAEQGPQTLERVGELMNFTRERVRQVEELVKAQLRPIARELAR